MKKGTPILWQRVMRVPVNRLLTLLLVCIGLLTANTARPQCGAGTNQVSVNWDILDYFTNATNYTNDGYITTPSLAYIQNFAFGPNNRLTINANTNITLGGEVNTHTGDLANYTGDDVLFTPTANGQTITISLESAASNLNFALYDIERLQSLTITAVNGVTPVNVNVATQGGSILTVGGTALLRTVTANNSSVFSNSNNGTATITFGGDVTSVTITFTNFGSTAQDIYLSDINACTSASFPLNYYAVAQPFTGQPGYVLHAFNRSVYYTNPANGFTRLLFTDPTPAGPKVGNINSMAYDPYNRWIYFVYSLTPDGDATTLKKYDVNTGAVSTVLANLETIGIPTTSNNGSESGSAGFYNGSYYIGIETANSGRNSGREAVIWRVDFNGSNVPYRASQVFAQPIDSSGWLIHDWSDFVMHDGILYNFDAAENDRSGAGITALDRNQSDIYHVDMMTGATIRYNKPGASSVPIWYPGQPAINWAGQVVQMYGNPSPPANAGGQPQSNPYITFYNGAGGIGTPSFLFSTPMFSPAVPSLGDAAEAFKPRSDFGDAPASYDNDPMAPATHEEDPLLRLGSTRNIEWSRTPSANADAEGSEEDAIGMAPALNHDATLTYTINNITVFNNTGGPATLAAWLDYNFDGVFQPGEGRIVTINSNVAPQTNISISWNNIYVPLTTEVNTFLRFRLTRQSNGMTVNDMNGWFSDGEVEDFEVVLGAALPKDIQSFNAKNKNNSSVDVQWSINVQQAVKSYEILRSTDNSNWISIVTVPSREGSGLQHYNFIDLNPAPGKSYYRVRVNYVAESANKLSEIRSVQFNNGNIYVRVLPNPAHEQAEIQVNAVGKGDAVIRVYDRTGRMVMNLKQAVDAGANAIRLNNLSKLSDGVYTVRTVVNGRTSSTQLVIKKQ